LQNSGLIPPTPLFKGGFFELSLRFGIRLQNSGLIPPTPLFKGGFFELSLRFGMANFYHRMDVASGMKIAFDGGF
jgi:hypothetical protein